MILKRAISKDGTVYRRDSRGQFHPGPPAPRSGRVLSRAFDAGIMSRLTSDWTFSPLSADAEIRQSFRNLRARSRDLERNDSYGEKFLILAEQNVIGSSGIGLQMKLQRDQETLNPETGEMETELDTEANSAVERAWKRQCHRDNYCVTRDMSATAADKLILRTMLRDGDLLIRKIPGYPNAFGFAIQIIEGDYLDDTYTDFRAVRCNCPSERGLPLCEHGTHEVRMGVELHGDWRFPVAYWLLGAHPGDYLVGSAIYGQRRIRVPVEEIIHPFIRKRPGQTRGIPAMACAMLRLKMLGGYSEAELVAARAGAQKMGFIESSVPESLFDQYFDADAEMGIINGAPGEIEELPMGKSFKAWDPSHPNGNFGPFNKEQLRGVAAGVNVSYTSLSGNIEDVNYSSMRGGLLEEREGWKGLQTFFIDEVKREIFDAWLRVALLSPLLDLPFDRFDEITDPDCAIWKPRRWPWVDPSKDIEAAKAAIEANLDTKSNIIAERGEDYEQVTAERAYEQQREKKLGITPAPQQGQQQPVETLSDAKEEASEQEPAEGIRGWVTINGAHVFIDDASVVHAGSAAIAASAAAALKKKDSESVAPESDGPLGKAFDNTLLHGTGFKTGQDLAGYHAVEKFDGHRVRWDGKHLRTRSGVKLKAPAHFTAGLPDMPIDAELYAGPGKRDQVTSVVSKGGDDWSALSLKAFDLPNHPGDYASRHAALAGLSLPQHVQLMPLRTVASTDEAIAHMHEVVARGGEGLILHKPGAKYSKGRIAGVVKLKPEHLERDAKRSADQPRDDHGRWVADGSAGIVEPDEARKMLLAGIDITDVLGNRVLLDKHIIEHWESEGKPIHEQNHRLRRLPEFIKTVESPHEVLRGDKQTIYLRAFTDERSKRRYMAGFIMENNQARSFFHFTRPKEMRKIRHGDPIYSRQQNPQ